MSALRFDLIPDCNRAHYPQLPASVEVVAGVATVRSYLTYMTPPPGLTEDAIAQLVPTLAPGFPEPGAWIPYDPEELHAIDMAGGAATHSLQKRK